MTKKKVATAVSQPQAKSVPTGARLPTAEEWQGILDSVDSGQGGKYRFIKDGKTRIRLVHPDPNRPTQFFRETERTFQGNTKVRFILWGLVMSPPREGDENKVFPIIIPRTVLTGILSLLADGYDLFSWNQGHGLTIIRSGESLNTSYNVLPSRSPVALDPKSLVFPDETIDELARGFAEDSKKRDANRGKGESPKAPGRGNAKVAPEADEDEEDTEDVKEEEVPW